MHVHTDKTQANKSRAVANVVGQMPDKDKPVPTFLYNRGEAVAQRRWQEMADNSPKTMRLKALQDMANNNTRPKHAAQLQTMANNHAAQQQQPIQKKENNTVLPDNLKTGVESLSRHSLDDVKIDFNSPRPAQLQARAYTQGTEIHVASGKEEHLPHEAWPLALQRVAANRAMQRMVASGELRLESRRGRGRGVPAGEAESADGQATETSDVVQRLMALEGKGGFKDISGAWNAGKRNKVTQIDDALKQFHKDETAFSQAQRLEALQHVIDLCEAYLALNPKTTNATRRAGVTTLRDQAIAERTAFAALVVDWDNAPAYFETKNTVNNYGNSQYTVTATGYNRYAPVNRGRAPDEVHFTATRHFCYLEKGSPAYNAVMDSVDTDVLVKEVAQGRVHLDIKNNIYYAWIEPQMGYYPFDFDYDPSNGTISNGHVGHKIMHLE